MRGDMNRHVFTLEDMNLDQDLSVQIKNILTEVKNVRLLFLRLCVFVWSLEDKQRGWEEDT